LQLDYEQSTSRSLSLSVPFFSSKGKLYATQTAQNVSISAVHLKGGQITDSRQVCRQLWYALHRKTIEQVFITYNRSHRLSQGASVVHKSAVHSGQILFIVSLYTASNWKQEQPHYFLRIFHIPTVHQVRNANGCHELTARVHHHESYLISGWHRKRFSIILLPWLRYRIRFLTSISWLNRKYKSTCTIVKKSSGSCFYFALLL